MRRNIRIGDQIGVQIALRREKGFAELKIMMISLAIAWETG